VIVARSGPELPFFIAWKAAIAFESLKYSLGANPPTEREIISTPSAIASSNAARMSAHHNSHRTNKSCTQQCEQKEPLLELFLRQGLPCLPQ
jgi:hypothetical protein